MTLLAAVIGAVVGAVLYHYLTRDALSWIKQRHATLTYVDGHWIMIIQGRLVASDPDFDIMLFKALDHDR
jgi:hypothetical protein